jgi:hypothetical protein
MYSYKHGPITVTVRYGKDNSSGRRSRNIVVKIDTADTGNVTVYKQRTIVERPDGLADWYHAERALSSIVGFGVTAEGAQALYTALALLVDQNNVHYSAEDQRRRQQFVAAQKKYWGLN